ncbi:MAG: tetratricopeptide repeat protein [Gelidibacter sp.]
MYQKNQFYYFLFYMFLFQSGYLFGSPLNTEKQVDSLLKASTNEVYENPKKSIKYGLSVFENDDNSTKLKIKGLMLVSLGYSSERDYQKALEYIIKANELSEKLDDPLLNIQILTRTGILYQQLKIFDKSMEVLNKSERLCLAYSVRDSVRSLLGKTFIVKGFIYKDNLNCDIALSFFDKGINEYEKLKGNFYNTNLSIAYYNKGNCYTMSSDYDNAIISFNKSIALAQSEKANSLESFALKGLADVYMFQGKHEDAVNLLQKALKLSKNVGDLVLNRAIYQGMFDNYSSLNQWDEYQKYYELFLKTESDIKISERNSISDSIDESTNIQNEKLNLIEKQFQNRIEILILVGILIIIFIVIMDKKTKKTFKKLQQNIDALQKPKI